MAEEEQAFGVAGLRATACNLYQINRKVPVDEWARAIFNITLAQRRANAMLGFFLGDAINQMLESAGRSPEKREKAWELALERLGGSSGPWADRLRHCSWVAERIPVHIRKLDVVPVWAVYAELASIPDADTKERLLDLYAQGRITREGIRDFKARRSALNGRTKERPKADN